MRDAELVSVRLRDHASLQTYTKGASRRLNKGHNDRVVVTCYSTVRLKHTVSWYSAVYASVWVESLL